MTASRTTPTAFVLVVRTGPSRKPISSIQWVPVMSPLPFRAKKPAKQRLSAASPFPRGRMAVTPVRTEAPSMSVTWPTSTPGTSVMAFRRPGAPNANGIPRSRPRGSTAPAADSRRRTRTAARQGALTRAILPHGPAKLKTRIEWRRGLEGCRATRSPRLLPPPYSRGRGARVHDRDAVRRDGGDPRRADPERAALPGRRGRRHHARRPYRVRRSGGVRDGHARHTGHGARGLRHRLRDRGPPLRRGEGRGDAGAGARLLQGGHAAGGARGRVPGRVRLEAALPGGGAQRGRGA